MGPIARFSRPARVTPETLNVAPALLGRALAPPARRVAAMALDLALIAVASKLINLWFVAAAGLVVWDAVKARRAAAPRGRWLWWAGIAALFALGAIDAWRERVERNDESRSRTTAAALRVAARAASAARAGAAASAAVAAPDVATAVMAVHVAELEAELRHLRAAPPDWRVRAARWLDEIGLGYGGALLYFTLTPLVWPGQTPGKKLLKLRVAELTGKPITAGLALKRFGGYAAGLATGGLGFAQALWDPNAQALQDKAAHTVVLDERALPNES